jgi:hypothetical protein
MVSLDGQFLCERLAALGCGLIICSVLTADPYAMVDDFVQEYRIKYHQEGPKAYWDLLQEKGDAYSVRQYLSNWCVRM